MTTKAMLVTWMTLLIGSILNAAPPAGVFTNLNCEGTYRGHLQGICTDDKESVFWSFTDVLVKTDREGKIVKKVSVASHHGDLCYHDGKVYVAVNLRKFNNAEGHAGSWVYVYDPADLRELTRHKAAEVIYGAGGIGYHDGRFFVVGGLPEDVNENYIYEYDKDFKFVKRHVLESGHTFLGIQTATHTGGYWWFGCYGKPARELLKADESFHMVGKYVFNCALGIVGLPDGSFLAAQGDRSPEDKKYMGSAAVADADAEKGLIVRDKNKK